MPFEKDIALPSQMRFIDLPLPGPAENMVLAEGPLPVPQAAIS